MSFPVFCALFCECLADPVRRMDLHEDAEKNVVTATFEFPGVKKEDIQLEVQNGRLTVGAETKADEERNENGYAVRERRYGKWSRTLQLPTGVKVSVERWWGRGRWAES